MSEKRKREVIDLSTDEPNSMDFSVHTSDIEFIASEATPSDGISTSEPDDEENELEKIYTILQEIQNEVRELRASLLK